LLLDWRNGDKAALDEMMPVLYEELRRLARHFLSAERSDHTLQPTALVHEAYLRLIHQKAVDWRNRAHFLGVAASMMRRILINYAEARNAAKRQGYAGALALKDAIGIFTNPQVDILHLSRSLDQLAELDPQQGKVVELRYFGGLSIEETAEVLGISPATVKREWSTARLWLLQRMEGRAIQ
jgi:RNA polymerase sigma factor (TIGR02999 family)